MKPWSKDLKKKTKNTKHSTAVMQHLLPPQFPTVFNIIKANLVRVGETLKTLTLELAGVCSQWADFSQKKNIHMNHIRYKDKTKVRQSICQYITYAIFLACRHL